ncbi:hypothetical protein DQ806_05040 [Salmonella enterica subsp. enterica serovar Okatie]|nr:hypothetical protein [Salmonella enterica subsp. enterica serovar Okatie]
MVTQSAFCAFGLSRDDLYPDVYSSGMRNDEALHLFTLALFSHGGYLFTLLIIIIAAPSVGYEKHATRSFFTLAMEDYTPLLLATW